METQKLYVSPSPHILSKNNTRMVMLGVMVALLPTMVASAFLYGPRILLLCGVTVAASVGFEALWCVVRKKPIPVGDFSAAVTGLILAYNLPPAMPIWMATIGAFIAVVVVKQLFGGLGCNFANPALVGRMVLQISFTGQMISYSAPLSAGVDAVAGATPLVASADAYTLMDLLLGTHPGVLGETCALTLILGGVFLMVTRIISPIIPGVYIGGVFVLKLLLSAAGGASIQVASMQALTGVLQGGLLLGAFFMATDYVTSPYTRSGKVVFAVGLALLTTAMREWSNMAEGVSYAILLMNLVVPYINGLCRSRPMGVAKKAKAGKEAGGNG